MRWLFRPSRLRRVLLRRAAVGYARHGWPIAPGAYPMEARFMCDRIGCPIHTCHPAFEDWQDAASTEPAQVAAWWSRRGHSVLLPTGEAFDVIETPGALGQAALEVLPAAHRGPVAVTPTGRWMFLVRPGDGLRPELSERLDVILHGEGSWVPAPPTRYPEGRVRWRVSPHATAWRLPYTYGVQQALVAAQAGLLAEGATPPARQLARPLPVS